MGFMENKRALQCVSSSHTDEEYAQLEAENAKLREPLERQLEKHKHQMYAPVTNDKETWCACFGCELARSILNA